MKRNCTYLVFVFLFLCTLCIQAYTSDDKVVRNVPLVYVDGGTFQMGSKDGERDEKPVHDTYLNSFYMGAYEITNAQYCIFLNEQGNQKESGTHWLDLSNQYCFIAHSDTGFVPKKGYENKPVTAVTWYGANAYCKWQGGRLPTESEWEYVAKGGRYQDPYLYSGSDDPADVAWYAATSGGRPQEIGKKQDNTLGIYDMTGNAWEWVYDWHGLYSSKEYDNPKGPETGKYKIIRGGSWTSFGTQNLRNTARIVMLPDQVANVTFRLCMYAEKEKRENENRKRNDEKRVSPPGF